MRYFFVNIFIILILGNLFAQNILLKSNFNTFDDNFTYYGNPLLQKGISGNCLSFDGIDDYAISNNLIFDYKKGFTISFWFKPLGLTIGENEYSTIVTNSKNNDNCYWSIKLSPISNYSFKIYFSLSINSKYHSLISQKTIETNQWSYLTCTFNSEHMAIYINGELDSKYKITAKPLNEENLRLVLGTNFYDENEKILPIWINDISNEEKNNVTFYHFNGLLSNLVLANQNLSSKEVLKQYENSLNKENEEVKIILYEPLETRGVRLVTGNIYIKGEVVPHFVAKSVAINQTEIPFDGKQFNYNYRIKQNEQEIFIKALDDKKNVIAQRNIVVSNNFSEKEKSFQGEYYALLIACNDYSDKKLGKLDNPIKDAKAFKEVLQNYYDFHEKNIVTLNNATYEQIIKELDNFAKKLKENDNLLIFYAGHGYWDGKMQQGYWLPVNVNLNNKSLWISNSIIKDYLKGFNARSVLVVSDACFSGGLFKIRGTETSNKYIEELSKYKARKALTSGVLTTVPDKSVFIEYLLRELKNNNKKYLPAEELYFKIKENVVKNSPTNQIPQYGEVFQTGDEGGDFIFKKLDK